MARRSGTSRVTQTQQDDEGGPTVERSYPSLRERNPVAYWIAILCVVAMVLSTVALSASAFL
ncbi:MAG: hypothetical protein AAGD35_20945 [Actinomycetota bacterium]